MIVKVKGLVLKAKNINENDKYLTVLCEEYGKISFNAAGARNFKSKNLVSAQPFAYSEFTLFKGSAFMRLNEAHIIENFYGIRTNLASLALAVYLADIACVICVGEVGGDGGILRLLLNTLYMLSNQKIPAETLKAIFELRVLTKSGFMPNLSECELCLRRNFESDAPIFFDYIGGNLICDNCLSLSNENEKGQGGNDEFEWLGNSQKKLARISQGALEAMRFVTGAKDEKLFSFSLSEDLAREFSKICEKYLLEQLVMNTDSLKYYKSCMG